MVPLSSETKSGNIKVTNRQNNQVVHYNLNGDYCNKTIAVKLTSREKEILNRSTRGFYHPSNCRSTIHINRYGKISQKETI